MRLLVALLSLAACGKHRPHVQDDGSAQRGAEAREARVERECRGPVEKRYACWQRIAHGK